jgi:hypothetical protein
MTASLATIGRARLRLAEVCQVKTVRSGWLGRSLALPTHWIGRTIGSQPVQQCMSNQSVQLGH